MLLLAAVSPLAGTSCLAGLVAAACEWAGTRG
jgi:hypothetical protein